MATEHDVKAKLTLDTRAAERSAGSLQDRVGALAAKIRGAEQAGGGLVKSLIGAGLGVVGLGAGIGMMGKLVGATAGYTAQLEKTKIGLGSILSGVEGVNYEAGKGIAADAFARLNQMAIESPAATGDLINVFQGIVAPLRLAGQSMDDVYKATNNTILAASALGVDFQQAQMDVTRMAQGQAGMDVRLFQALKSAKAITEETEQWNKMSAPERAAKLTAALAKFEASGGEFGRSWSGQISTLLGTLQENARIFMGPVMQAMAGQIGRINTYLQANGTEIANKLSRWGLAVADQIKVAGDRVAALFQKIQANWGKITGGFSKAMAVLDKHGPMIAKLIAAQQIMGVARGPAAAALEMGGNAFGGMAAKSWGAATAAAGAAKASFVPGAGAMSGFGGALAAELGSLKAAAVAGAGALAPFALLLGGVAALGVAVAYNWQLVLDVVGNLSTTTMPVFNKAWSFLKKVWDGLRPVLEAVGLLIGTVLVVAWRLLMSVLETVLDVLNPVVEVFRMIGEAIDKYLMPHLRNLLRWASEPTAVQEEVSTRKKAQDIQVLQYMTGLTDVPAAKGKTPDARSKTTIHVDKMVIKQEFRGNKDPDRVVAMMIQDITKQAEQRVSVRWAGALTR